MGYYRIETYDQTAKPTPPVKTLAPRVGARGEAPIVDPKPPGIIDPKPPGIKPPDLLPPWKPKPTTPPVINWQYMVVRNDSDDPVALCESQEQAQHIEMLLNDRPRV